MKRLSDSGSAVHQDALYVNWHLLDGCNHDCEYSHEPESALNERFSRESLLSTAYRILSLNRPEYIFHLYGGEPTIHPHFPELFKYLATSGRNVRMVLDTNGLRSLDYYRKLFKGMPHGRLCMRIAVHCKYMELQPLLLLIAHCVEGGQFCRVAINHVPEYADKARMFSEKLLMLRGALPFEADILFPLGGSAEWTQAFRKAFAATVQPPLEMPAWALPVRNLSRAEHGDFVCVGATGVQVAPDGACTVGLRENDPSFVTRIMEYAPMRADFPPAPSFATAGDAEAWLAEFRVRTLQYELDGGPVRHPLHTDMDEEQQVRARLKRLKPESSYRRKRLPQPELWQESRADILKALSCLKDEDSRTVFLRYLKSRLVGDSAYLVRSAYALFDHPCLKEYGALVPDESGCRLIRLSEDVTHDNVTALLPRIQWYRPVLELVLPQTRQDSDLIINLHAALPDYHLYLGQHGAQTVLYGVPSTPRKRYRPVPPRTLDGQPLVSIILAASGTAEDVARSMESAWAQNLPRYEVVIVQDGDATALQDVIDGFVRREPWHVRPYRFESSLSLSAAYEAGLDMAQGEYVCFLRSGDTLKEGALSEVVNILEREQADVAVALPSALRTTSIEGSAALTRFLTGQLGQCGTRDKVYRTSLIHGGAVSFGDLPEKMEDDLFNLPLFHFAGKVVSYAGELSIHPDDVEVSPENVFRAFLTNLGTLGRFCAAHGLPIDSPEVRAYVLRRFHEIKSDILHFIREAENAGRLGEVLDDEAVRVLTLTPAIVQSICEEFAPAYCKANTLSVQLLAEPLPAIYSHYHGACEAFDIAYPLSIIVTVEDKASLVCLERLAQEESALVECVLIDNATSEEMAAVLEDYADMYPNFRLFRMKQKASAPQCRNVGLEQARGDAVIFMESGDEPMPHFVASAVDAMRDKKVDAAVFGVQRVDAEGISDFPFTTTDAGTGAEAIAFFLEKEMELASTGIVFRRERLLFKSIRHNPVHLEWDADFALRALREAPVTMCSEVACLCSEKNRIESLVAYQGSFEAACGAYTFLRAMAEELQESHAAMISLTAYIAKSIKEVWLPLCATRMREENGTHFIVPNFVGSAALPLFLRALMSEYAQFADIK